MKKHLLRFMVFWAVFSSGIVPKANGLHAQNWQTSITGLQINKVWMLNSTTGWAVGNNGLILPNLPHPNYTFAVK